VNNLKSIVRENRNIDSTLAVDELTTAAVAGTVAREAVQVGVADIAAGSEEIGAGEATVAMSEVLEEGAKR
jgi:hypothetical protein